MLILRTEEMIIRGERGHNYTSKNFEEQYGRRGKQERGHG
jgi:hypothetical protein